MNTVGSSQTLNTMMIAKQEINDLTVNYNMIVNPHSSFYWMQFDVYCRKPNSVWFIWDVSVCTVVISKALIHFGFTHINRTLLHSTACEVLSICSTFALIHKPLTIERHLSGFSRNQTSESFIILPETRFWTHRGFWKFKAGLALFWESALITGLESSRAMALKPVHCPYLLTAQQIPGTCRNILLNILRSVLEGQSWSLLCLTISIFHDADIYYTFY